MLHVKKLPLKIHTSFPFEAVLEPNSVAHITELNSHIPWQRKTERKRQRQEELKPFKAFIIHGRGDRDGSHKVLDIEPPKPQ